MSEFKTGQLWPKQEKELEKSEYLEGREMELFWIENGQLPFFMSERTMRSPDKIFVSGTDTYRDENGLITGGVRYEYNMDTINLWLEGAVAHADREKRSNIIVLWFKEADFGETQMLVGEYFRVTKIDGKWHVMIWAGTEWMYCGASLRNRDFIQNHFQINVPEALLTKYPEKFWKRVQEQLDGKGVLK